MSRGWGLRLFKPRGNLEAPPNTRAVKSGEVHFSALNTAPDVALTSLCSARDFLPLVFMGHKSLGLGFTGQQRAEQTQEGPPVCPRHREWVDWVARGRKVSKSGQRAWQGTIAGPGVIGAAAQDRAPTFCICLGPVVCWALVDGAGGHGRVWGAERKKGVSMLHSAEKGGSMLAAMTSPRTVWEEG